MKSQQDLEYELGLKKDLENLKKKERKERKEREEREESFPTPRSLRQKRLDYFDK